MELEPQTPSAVPAADGPPAAPEAHEAAETDNESAGVMIILREWADALVIAFVLAMFVRVFLVELFKIPTGSMTPTLIGDEVVEIDRNGDGVDDLVVNSTSGPNLVFLNRGGRYELDKDDYVSQAKIREWASDGLLKTQYDRILVSKFAYWFSPPDRGDVIVFKVPENMWNPQKPIFIKRCVGLPGDTISFDGRLIANGEKVTEPEFFLYQDYVSGNRGNRGRYGDLPYIHYDTKYGSRIKEVEVPEDMVFAMGDNTNNSLDGRAWGGVPLANLKGKAFMRYWPFRKTKFIR